MSAASAREYAQRARTASRKLQAMPTEQRVVMLNRIADALVANEEAIMVENKKACCGAGGGADCLCMQTQAQPAARTAAAVAGSSNGSKVHMCRHD